MFRLVLCAILCAAAAASPDGALDFKVPKKAAYDKGDRCQLVNTKGGRVLARIDPAAHWSDGDGTLTPVWLARPGGGWLCALRFEGGGTLRDLALLDIAPDGATRQTALRPLLDAGAAQWAQDARVTPPLLTNVQVSFEGAGTLVVRALADSRRQTCPLEFRYDIANTTLSLAAGKLGAR